MIQFSVAVLAALSLSAVLAAAPSRAQDPAAACANSPAVVGGCVTLRGRATACTGVPNLRIWVIGTKRVLGVADAAGNVAGEALLPGGLEEALLSATPCSKAAFGRFTVCPLTPSRPGAMQTVCVSGADQIVVKDW